MKPIKNFVLAVLFVSAVALNTYAGEMETPGYVPPPPPPNNQLIVSANEPAPDSEVNSLTGEQISASEQLYYDALMAMLSLF